MSLILAPFIVHCLSKIKWYWVELNIIPATSGDRSSADSFTITALRKRFA